MIKIMDCTLRDGANVVGKGFDARMTKMMLEGLISCNVPIIEMGNCLGIGAYEADQSIAPLTDEEYLKLVQPYLSQAEIGMFIGVKNVNEKNVELARKYGINFLRVGANAGDGRLACEGIKRIKAAGLRCFYSMMKGYLLSADDLAEEAKMLEDCGLDEITIMDSAGTMTPDQVGEYVEKMVSQVKRPVAFHGHNNLGLSVANAMAAQKAGAQILDCGLMGMARSAGNCATELAVAVFERAGLLSGVDLMTLLHFIDRELGPAMEEYGYHVPVKPLDLVYGISGCHSSFARLFKEVAEEKQVDLYLLIIEVSKINQKNPDRELIEQTAERLKKGE